MYLRLRFRLRTLLIVVALLSPPLAGMAVVARHGGIKGFRNYHAHLAASYWIKGDHLSERAYFGQNNGRLSPEEVEELRRRAAVYFGKAHWHEFLSGHKIRVVAST